MCSLAGAVKNVIAIGAGMSRRYRFYANARTALITRGLAEMSSWRGAGADPATFMGMAGLGDLVPYLYRQPVATAVLA